MIYSEPIELTGAAGYVQIDIPFQASYCAVMNQSTPAALTFATGKIGVKPAGGIPISPGQNLSFDIPKTQTATIFFEGNNGTNNPTIQFSDVPLSMSSSNSQVNIVGGVTLAPGSGVSINGTPTVQLSGASSVSINNTPNVSVTNQQINTIVGNPQNNPVPTVPQTYYGTGADGAFNPTANYTFTNSANQADIKNFTSISIPSGVTVNWSNPAHYVCWFVQGNVDIQGTIHSANATANVSSSQPKITLFNGAITVPVGGQGGQGGASGAGTGGIASPYGPGSGGGGVGASSSPGGGGGAGAGYGGNGGNAGGGTGPGSGTNGSATSNGGSGFNGGPPGQNATQSGGATLIIIASGTITISGTILSNGGNGGNGGATTYGGNGGGGAGGGIIFLYSGSTVTITGTLNINGGTGGVKGDNGGFSVNGANGQGGTVLIYQYNNQIAG